MKQLTRYLLISGAFSLVFLAGTVRAHGDADQPLYVAEGGKDRGDCLDADNPCATIGYALSMATKGGQVRVAAGNYDVGNVEDIFHLVGNVVNVSGGYAKGDKNGISNRGVSTLTGVPYQYRDLLESRGFQVIADRKGIDHDKVAAAERLLDLHSKLKSSMAATPCVGGSAGGLPCTDVDLLSHVGFVDISAAPVAGNDVWGFVDLNTGREYAIAGFNLGTAVFDVTDAENPREIGFIDGQSATWRDIKVYQFFDAVADRWKAYAYVTTDGSTDGLFIIDLTGLPHSIRRISYASDITRAHNIYATNTDYSTGVSLTGAAPTLVIAGSNRSIGQYRAYSLADPESPAFITGGTGTGYMHDASSLIITDSRVSQCPNATAYCELLLDFNENSVEIWDITNAATPQRVSDTSYVDVGYVHSGWWSEDKQFIFVHDELDERNSNLNTTLRVYSVANLNSPVLAGTWTGPTRAIDHNGFVRGNRYYMSNYSRGLTVLDITNPAVPSAVGRLDTYPATDGTMFVGAWGAYPFFPSGNIAISDIDSGFYMAADQTRDVQQGKLEFATASSAAEEGQAAQLAVRRLGGSSGNVTVDYEVVRATADAQDVGISTGTLSWSAADSSDKTISIVTNNDGASEGMEMLMVRLINPTGGATLGNRNASHLYLSDPGAAAEVRFSSTAIEATERGFGSIIAVLKRTGNATGAASVDYLVSGGDATPGLDFQGNVAGTINWASGDGNPKTIEFVLENDGIVEADETIELSLVNPVGMTVSGPAVLVATIRDGGGANLAPNAIAGISQTRNSGAQVTLDGSQSSDPNGDILTYQWAQIGGQNVILNNAASAVATFTAPTVTSDTMLQFRLTVADPGGLSDSATTTVTVTRAPAPPSGGSSKGSMNLFVLLGLAALAMRRRLRRRDVA